MNKKNNRFLYNVMATLIAFGIVGVYALFALNFTLFNPLVQVLRQYSITDFYYQVIGSSAVRDTSRIVTIVDMKELYDRRDIAYALSEVQEQHPKVIGVDILFDGLKSDNPMGDSLIQDIAAKDTSIVFALQYYDDSFNGQQYNSVKQSFFADSIPNLKQGLVNMPLDKYDSLRRKISVAKTVRGKLRPSMIKQLADEYAEQEIVPLKDNMLNINWSPVDFRVVPYDSIADYGEYLTDRIVLFGAWHDDNDMHLTPQGNIAGIKLLAYGIESMVKQTSITDSPWWLTALLSFLIVLFTKYLFDHCEKFARERKNGFLRIGLKAALVIGILKFAWMAVIMYAGFIVFAKYNFSINFAWALSAIPFIGPAADLYKVISNSFSKEEK